MKSCIGVPVPPTPSLPTPHSQDEVAAHPANQAQVEGAYLASASDASAQSEVTHFASGSAVLEAHDGAVPLAPRIDVSTASEDVPEATRSASRRFQVRVGGAYLPSRVGTSPGPHRATGASDLAPLGPLSTVPSFPARSWQMHCLPLGPLSVPPPLTRSRLLLTWQPVDRRRRWKISAQQG